MLLREPSEDLLDGVAAATEDVSEPIAMPIFELKSVAKSSFLDKIIFIVKSNALVYDLRNETYKSLPYEISD